MHFQKSQLTLLKIYCSECCSIHLAAYFTKNFFFLPSTVTPVRTPPLMKSRATHPIGLPSSPVLGAVMLPDPAAGAVAGISTAAFLYP